MRNCQLSSMRVASDFREVATHQRQVVLVVDAAQVADALDRCRIADVAAERVARVGGIGDHAAGPHDARGARDQPVLGVERVNGKELGHGQVLGWNPSGSLYNGR